MREASTHRALIATVLLTDAAHYAWPGKVRMVQDRFGAAGNTRRTFLRILDTVEGVDPIDFAPALLSGYRSQNVALDVDPEAWRMFLGTIERAASTYPLKAAWRDVRDVTAGRGWCWPSYPTIYRRWSALEETNRRALRHGREDAARSLTQPALRDKTTIGPLQGVSQDGRRLDFRVDRGDGRPSRPTMLVLVDVASNKVLDHELARSENAVSTVRMIRRTCQTHGIFDRLYIDNGSAFAGHLVANAASVPQRGQGR